MAGEEEPTEKQEGSSVSLTALPTTIEAALMPSHQSVIITEPDEPFRIVHVNEAWCRSCGFDAEEVLGQTCKIMQGPGTCKATLKMLRQALLLRRNFAVQLLNYSKQGRPFMNTLQVGPLTNATGQVTHFIGVVVARFLDGSGLVPPSVQQLGVPAPGDMRGDIYPVMHDGSVAAEADAEDQRQYASSSEDRQRIKLDEQEGGLDDEGEDGAGGQQGRVPPFLTKLTEIMTAEPAEVVTLNPESASFTVWDPNRFAKEVLPRYFKHNKLGSFSQQLHTYGFRRRTSSGSLDSAVEFYHEQYTGEPADFLAWIRAGGAVSKRTSHTRTPAVGLPPPQLLNDLWAVNEGIRQLALTFQQVSLPHPPRPCAPWLFFNPPMVDLVPNSVTLSTCQVKSAHSAQIRTILAKLTLRGLLTPESASYLSALPPATPNSSHNQNLPSGMQQPHLGWDSLHPRPPSASEDGLGLQAQLDALEAGLPPLLSSQAYSTMSETNDFQGEEALQMYVDSAPGLQMANGLMKDLRQQPYPVDVISNLLNRDRAAQS